MGSSQTQQEQRAAGDHHGHHHHHHGHHLGTLGTNSKFDLDDRLLWFFSRSRPILEIPLGINGHYLLLLVWTQLRFTDLFNTV